MSVYSGFATRDQENQYNSMIETLLITLTRRIIKFYTNESTNQQKFKALVKKILKKMFLLQKSKYYAPKFTNTVIDLVQFLKIEIDLTNLDQTTSKFSESFFINQSTQKIGLQNSFLRSKSILQNKKNAIQNYALFAKKQQYHKDIMHTQRKTISPNQFSKIEDSFNISKQEMKAAARLKLKYLRNMKQIGNKVNMPRMKDYMPKQQQLRTSIMQTLNNMSKQKKKPIISNRKKNFDSKISIQA